MTPLLDARRARKSGLAVRRTPAPPPAPQSRPAKPPLRDLDRMVHERLRLGILSALAVNDSLTFNELKTLLEITDGNLSDHARKLQIAGYLRVHKGYAGRKPQTAYALTARGKQALKTYLDQMQALLEAAGASLRA